MWDAASLYGSTPQAPSYAPGVGAAPTQQMGVGDIKDGWRGLLDPDNPLFWLGVLLLVTFGAAGVAGSVRLGRARLSADVGRA